MFTNIYILVKRLVMNDIKVENPILPIKQAIIIIGNYGSGKSEVSVNWAFWLKEWGVQKLHVVDLDIVNPYFRSREAIEELTKVGIDVVAPQGERFFADLPIILPEIKGLFQDPQGTAIFDVGGDDVGARVLRSFEGYISNYELLQVVNTNRPFTNSFSGVIKMQKSIETSAALNVTGYIGNTHLMDETEVDTILNGIEFMKKLSDKTGIPTRFVTADVKFYDTVIKTNPPFPVMPLIRRLAPTWKGGITKINNKPMLQV